MRYLWSHLKIHIDDPTGMTGNFAKNWKMWQKYLQKFGKDELQLNFEKMIHQCSPLSAKAASKCCWHPYKRHKIWQKLKLENFGKSCTWTAASQFWVNKLSPFHKFSWTVAVSCSKINILGAIYSQVSNNRLIGAKWAITGKLGASSFFKQNSQNNAITAKVLIVILC